LLGRAGYVVFNTRSRDYYARDSLFTSNNDSFRDDPVFQLAYARGVKASGGVDPHMEWRVHVALWAACAAARVPGDFVECGVNAGFVSSAIMHHLNWAAIAKRFYLIDTFSGPVLTQYSAEEVSKGRLQVAEKALASGATSPTWNACGPIMPNGPMLKSYKAQCRRFYRRWPSKRLPSSIWI
jgi:hypothetical protein